jgi:hypothetical protein
VANREYVSLIDEYQSLYAHDIGGLKRYHFKKETHFHKEYHQKDSPTFIKNLTLQRDSRNIIRVKERKKNSTLINVIIVIRWDTLLRIFLPEGKN